MPKPSLELPKIPAETIFELRRPEELDALSLDSRSDYTFYRAIQWTEDNIAEMRRSELWTAEEIRAFEIGTQIGSALVYQFVDRPEDSPYQFAACRDSIGELEKRITNPASFNRHTIGRLKQLETRANLTAVTFERIASIYVPAEEELLKFAKRGAATVHSAIHAIDTLAYQEGLRDSQESDAHLSLVP